MTGVQTCALPIFASELSGMADINIEQIYAWDPDIIYITNFSRHMPEDLYVKALIGFVLIRCGPAHSSTNSP